MGVPVGDRTTDIYGNPIIPGSGNGGTQDGVIQGTGGPAAPPPGYHPPTGPPGGWGTQRPYRQYYNNPQQLTPWGSPEDPNASFDPGQIALRNRQTALGYGQVLTNQFGGDRDFYQANEDSYRRQADESYGNGTNVGYTPDEAGAITREDAVKSGVASDADYAGLYATDAEKRGMTGDTSSYYKNFQQSDQDRMRGINSKAYTNDNSYIGSGGQDMADATNNESDSYRNAIDPDKLSQSADYRQQLEDAMNKKDLSQSSEFVDKYRMTPEQQQEMVNQTASNVGAQVQSQKDEIARRAAASGNANPLAIAAAEDRANRTGQASTANAVRGARVDALEMAAQREKNIEDERLSANQRYAGLKTSVLSDEEKQRIAAEEFQTGAKMDAAGRIGEAGRGTAKYLTNARLGAEDENARRGTGTEQYITNMGTGIAKSVDQANVDRSNSQYRDRANLGTYQIGNKYSQNMGTNTFLSGANKNVADSRIAGKNRYQDYLSHNVDTNLGASQNAGQQQIGVVGTTGGQAGVAAGQYGNYVIGRQGAPTTGSRVASGIAGFLSAI